MFAKLGNSISNGWALGNEAFALMKQHPKLLVFPLMSGLAFITLVGLILAGAFYNPAVLGFGKTMDWTTALALSFGMYLLLAFIATFFNTALCGTVLSRHMTGEVSLRHGFAAAIRRLPQILAWSIFAATIGVILAQLTRILEEYLSWFGTILGALLQTGWAATIYFVAPVLAVEGVGPITALKRSGSLLRARWGETAGAEFSTTWALWPLHLFGLIVIAALFATGFFSRGATVTTPVLVLGGLFMLYLLTSITLHSIMSGILKSHLYLYAKTGTVPRGGDPAVYARAFGKS